MTPHVPKGAKGFQLDRVFKEVGRIRLVTGTKNKRRFMAYDGLLTELYEDGKLDILRAIKDRRVSIREVYDARRRGALPYSAGDLVIGRKLWPAIDRWLAADGAKESTRKRYRVSWLKFKRLSGLPEAARIEHLNRVDFRALRRKWDGDADWNRMRAAVSRFLSVTLGDKNHPFRRQVVARIPKAVEPKSHRPDITPELFAKIVASAPEHVRPAYVMLASTGMRVGEYLALDRHNLQPLVRGILVPGIKRKESARVIELGPVAWAWAERAVPSPLRYKWLRINWKRACAEHGRDYRLHDLRHLTGHILADAGMADSKIATVLGHSSTDTTFRYTQHRELGEAARAVDSWLEEVVA